VPFASKENLKFETSSISLKKANVARFGMLILLAHHGLNYFFTIEHHQHQLLNASNPITSYCL